ncbi:MAG TPA: DUF192 domain-containing protein [Actinomycetota bacterium]|nr:DUF192 domain-containing protein [Actinomycetota bacterium]
MLYMVISPALGGIFVALTLVLGACGAYGSDASTDPSPTQASPSPGPTFDVSSAIIRGDDGSVLIKVEVAQSAEQRSRGLMFRDSLPADAGMVFLFFEPTQGGFWMKNTKIPLSIAFFGEGGEILDILNMEPCRADPCPTYTPDATYFGALEVNQGAFEEWGISEGDVVRMNQ